MSWSPVFIAAQVVAQATWSYQFEPSDSVLSVTSCLEYGPDKLLVLGGNVVLGGQWAETPSSNSALFVCRFEGAGTLVQRSRIVPSIGTALPTTLLDIPGEPGFVGLGAYRDPLPLVDSLPFTAGFFVFNDDLDLVATHTMGPTCFKVELDAICQAADSTVVSLGWSFTSTNNRPYRGYRFGSSGDSLRTCEAWPGPGFPPLTIRPWPNGGYLCSTYSGWSNFPGPASMTILEEDLCQVRVNVGAPQVDPPPEHPFAYIGYSVNALPLGQSRILVAGEYFHNPALVTEPRGAIQVIDTTGALIRQRTFHSQYLMDRPGELICVDTVANDLFYFAQMENRHPDVANVGMPDQVHVFLLDTLLNVVGEYIIDGIPSNTLYALRNIKTAGDGGVYLLGRTLDQNQPELGWRGWVAKIGRDEFTTSVLEQGTGRLQLFPNPGIEGFDLVLGERISGASLELVDMQGRIVLVQKITGINHHIATPELASGMYLVRLSDRHGGVVAQQRWVKQ